MPRHGDDAPPVRLGVSSCLLGEEVRYDGRHKHQPFLTGVLGEAVRWVPVCPELDIGLGVPREPIHLLAGPGDVRLVGVETGTEHTGAMRAHAERRAGELAGAGLDGYVLKSGSPSCGLGGVPVHDPVTGAVTGHDRGRFAATLVDRIPDLPVVEEDRLAAADVRDRFLEQVCARYRWRRRVGEDPSPDAIVELHARHEVQVVAHSPAAHRELGALVARAGDTDPEELSEAYRLRLVGALQEPTTRERHVDALQHLVGMLDGTQPDLRDAVDRYGDGRAPWTEVADLLRDAAPGAPAGFGSQTYLDPLREVGLAPASW